MWEHIISHYIYASGFVGMLACEAAAYSDFEYLGALVGNDEFSRAFERELAAEGSSRKLSSCLNTSETILLLSSAAVLGLSVASVAIDFPSGLITGLAYIVLASSLILLHLHRSIDRQSLVVFGRSPVLHYFLCSYAIGLLLILVWIGTFGWRTRSQAGVA